MEDESVPRLIHDALARFHELPFLRTHPLGSRLGGRDAASPAELQRRLLGALERLRPPPGAPRRSPRWRQYHYLRRRYFEGASLEQIQGEMAVGDRQARREHRAALRALAAALDVPAGRASPEAVEGEGVLHGDEAALEAELVWVEWGASAAPADLRPAVTDALDLVQKMAVGRRVAFEPTLATAPPVSVIETVLRQLLLNLLGYLISSFPGSRIGIAAAEAGPEVELRFQLRGASARWRRATDRAGDPINYGRLLSAARCLAERQGGRLVLGADGATGTLAQLFLPAAHATTVLVVDDNPDVGHLFRRCLRGAGFRVVQARNGPGAFELVRVAAPDVVVLDLMLPVQDGWELFRELRTRPETRELPVVACSVLPERELALSLAVDDFLAKPVTRQSLLAALEPYRAGPGRGRRGSPSGSQ